MTLSPFWPLFLQLLKPFSLFVQSNPLAILTVPVGPINTLSHTIPTSLSPVFITLSNSNPNCSVASPIFIILTLQSQIYLKLNSSPSYWNPLLLILLLSPLLIASPPFQLSRFETLDVLLISLPCTPHPTRCVIIPTGSAYEISHISFHSFLFLFHRRKFRLSLSVPELAQQPSNWFSCFQFLPKPTHPVVTLFFIKYSFNFITLFRCFLCFSVCLMD